MDDLQRVLKVFSKDKFSSKEVKWLIEKDYNFVWDSKKIPLKKLKGKYKNFLLMRFFTIKEMNKHINSLIRIFKKNKIPLVLLKGAGENYLKKPDFIYTSDIDILIKKKDIKRVDKVLINAGYKRDSLMSKYYSKFHFHYVYTNQKYSKFLEVHWALIDKCFDFNFDVVWNKRIKKVDDYVFVLEPEFEVIYLIVSCFREVCRHFLKDGLRIKRIMESDFDFKKFLYYVHFHKADDFVEHFFMLCNKNGIFNKHLKFKTRSLYRKMLLRLFFSKMKMKPKGWNLRHFFFLFLLYPNPKHLSYYFRKGVHYLMNKKHHIIIKKLI